MSSESPSSEITHHRSVTASEKEKAVLRLIQGENPEELARELEVSAERLLGWRRRFMQAGRAALMQRREHRSSRSQERRKKMLQWAALAAALLVVIWAVTRFAGGAGGGGQ